MSIEDVSATATDTKCTFAYYLELNTQFRVYTGVDHPSAEEVIEWSMSWGTWNESRRMREVEYIKSLLAIIHNTIKDH